MFSVLFLYISMYWYLFLSLTCFCDYVLVLICVSCSCHASNFILSQTSLHCCTICANNTFLFNFLKGFVVILNYIFTFLWQEERSYSWSMLCSGIEEKLKALLVILLSAMKRYLKCTEFMTVLRVFLFHYSFFFW